MKKSFCIILSLLAIKLQGQELFVFAEPASNMPAHSISVKVTGNFVTSDNIYNRFSQRIRPQVMFGFSKKFMLHIGTSFSNMHTPGTKYESAFLYAKYRFFSNDDIHKHFRMAVFADAATSKAPFHYDEISLMGDKSGIEAGVIATQLWNRFALSGSLSHTQVLDKSRFNKVIYIPTRLYQSLNYSLSGGYLLLPKEYTSYRQVNLNLYAEVIGQQSLDSKKYYFDVAPALQFIFNSNAKVDIGYRFKVSSNMTRMSDNSWQVSLERTFFNALKK